MDKNTAHCKSGKGALAWLGWATCALHVGSGWHGRELQYVTHGSGGTHGHIGRARTNAPKRVSS